MKEEESVRRSLFGQFQKRRKRLQRMQLEVSMQLSRKYFHGICLETANLERKFLEGTIVMW